MIMECSHSKSIGMYSYSDCFGQGNRLVVGRFKIPFNLATIAGLNSFRLSNLSSRTANSIWARMISGCEVIAVTYLLRGRVDVLAIGTLQIARARRLRLRWRPPRSPT